MMKGKLKKAVALVTALSCVQISPLAVTEVEPHRMQSVLRRVEIL